MIPNAPTQHHCDACEGYKQVLLVLLREKCLTEAGELFALEMILHAERVRHGIDDSEPLDNPEVCHG